MKMQTKPLVSTITPCFRMEKYLPLFLEWLPKQTFFDKIEVVLDHNEPTQEEIKLVKDFQKKYPGRIKHIVIEKVDPIGTSMNRCIKEASGEFLTIWNVDDLRTDNSIEQQAKILIENPEIDIVYGNYRTVDKFGKNTGKLIDHSIYTEKDLRRGMIIGPFFMFRKKILEKSGMFDEQLKSGADFDLAIRLALNGKVMRAPGELGYYLDEGKGASTRPDSLQPIEREVIKLRYYILDKLDFDYLDKSIKYNIYQLKNEGRWINVSRFIPNYERFAVEQQKIWDLSPEHLKKKKNELRLRTIKHLLYRLGLYGFARKFKT